MSYFSMHNHSMYSFQDGYATPKEYLDRATQIGLKGFAITEHGNQCSWVYFDQLKKEYPNVKVVYGIEFYLCDDVYIEDNNNRYYHLLVLAKDEEGRKILNRLQRLSNEHFYYRPRVDLNMFRKEDCSHLIVGSGCLASSIAKHRNDIDYCKKLVTEYKVVFPNFYLEMQSHKYIDQVEYNRVILQLSEETNTPFIITTDSHYANNKDDKYQARHVQIAQDKETLTEVYEGCYLQSDNEIHECMDSQIGYDNVNKGLKETLNILDTIDIVNMTWQKPQLPLFEFPSDFKSDYEFINYLVKDIGWKKRGLDKLPENEKKLYLERIEEELNVIQKTGYTGYFLIVWDFIKYAKENKMAVGAGRGSSCSSCVNWLLGITEPDPLKYDLVFSRFLNEERISLPDIDSDFGNRDDILTYLSNKYGHDKVALVCNFNYITPLVAIRNVGKVLGLPYSLTSKISSRFTFSTWDENVAHNQDLLDEYSEYEDLFDIASHLSGRINTFGSHACGIVIARTSLDDYLGSNLNTSGEYVVNVDKRVCEDLGLIKFDVLGVSNLMIVQEILHDLKLDEHEIDVNNTKFINDKETYELIGTGKTDAIFQLESAGMKDLCRRIKPKNIREVSDILALYRPDAMGSLEDYISNKHNQSNIKYWCDEVKPILNVTNGVLLYQEQMLSIVRDIGGRTYGGADRFRKGVGKKDLALVQKEASMLKEEIIKNNFSEEIAETISSYLKSFGGYLFCLSHSIGYSVLSLQTAYLKAHYPLYFFKALLNQNKADFGKINKYILDAKSFNIEVVAPNINHSNKDFSIVNNKILFGLGAIKGIGSKLVTSIIEERELNGNFKGMNDFLNRVNVPKQKVVSLIKSGAIPCKNKMTMLLSYCNSICDVNEYKPVKTFTLTLDKAKDKYGIDFKSLSKEDRLIKLNEFKKLEYDSEQNEKRKKKVLEFKEKYLKDEKLWEFETLSIFLKNNPFEKALDYLTPIGNIDIGGKAVIVGVISNIQKKKDRNKNEFCFINLYSSFGIIEVVCWSSQYKAYEDLVKKGQSVAVLCVKKEELFQVEQMKTYSKWLESQNLKHLE